MKTSNAVRLCPKRPPPRGDCGRIQDRGLLVATPRLAGGRWR